ncbi:hypothetical protein B566_EDAN018607 [Ephemera danica]|nr:hypothetical protein B566_EDAN018607 [Ephemera danica]
MENEIITVDGENYIRVNKFIVDTNPEEILMHLEGLFGGDVRLGEEMNKFLNMNSKTVYGELKPAIEETFGEVFKQISNKIFLQVPHKSIFLRD